MLLCVLRTSNAVRARRLLQEVQPHLDADDLAKSEEVLSARDEDFEVGLVTWLAKLDEIVGRDDDETDEVAEEEAAELESEAEKCMRRLGYQASRPDHTVSNKS